MDDTPASRSMIAKRLTFLCICKCLYLIFRFDSRVPSVIYFWNTMYNFDGKLHYFVYIIKFTSLLIWCDSCMPSCFHTECRFCAYYKIYICLFCILICKQCGEVIMNCIACMYLFAQLMIFSHITYIFCI